MGRAVATIAPFRKGDRVYEVGFREAAQGTVLRVSVASDWADVEWEGVGMRWKRRVPLHVLRPTFEGESPVAAGARPSRGLGRTSEKVDHRQVPSLYELLTLADCPEVADPAALAQWLHTRGVACRFPRWRVFGLPRPNRVR